MNNDRRRIRDVFSRIDDRNDIKNIHLKDYLITICPQITETKFDDENILKRRYSRLNAIINRRFLKRHYNKRDDRIVFYNFIENSLNKNLIHTHSIFRIPRFLLNELNDFFDCLKSVVKDKFKFSITINHRPNIATRYMTKKFNKNNDRYFVN
jgi:hypothetical protein